MSEISVNGAARSNEVTATNESGKSLTSTSESDNELWFSNAARQLLGSDPGLALHYLTDVPESTCYRAIRLSAPSLYLYRKLLWCEQGDTWLNVIMDGCNAEWWRERQISLRKAALYDQAQQIFSEFGRRPWHP